MVPCGAPPGARRSTIAAAWEAGFYPIYAEAQHVFGVNWLLLASIHDQESAFSTAPSTYSGLNFAHCCGGPMQFNVTNGPVSTWQLVRDAYRYGQRPAVYDHRTVRHPSIYDDFDSVMAAAWLLSSDGAGAALDDLGLVGGLRLLRSRRYRRGLRRRGAGARDRLVPARLLHQLRVEPTLVEAVQAAYGAPVSQVLVAHTAAHHARPGHSRARKETSKIRTASGR